MIVILIIVIGGLGFKIDWSLLFDHLLDCDLMTIVGPINNGSETVIRRGRWG